MIYMNWSWSFLRACQLIRVFSLSIFILHKYQYNAIRFYNKTVFIFTNKCLSSYYWADKTFTSKFETIKLINLIQFEFIEMKTEYDLI